MPDAVLGRPSLVLACACLVGAPAIGAVPVRQDAPAEVREHGHLASLGLTRVEEGDLVFLIQQPPRAPAARATGMAAAHAEAIGALRERFRTTLAEGLDAAAEPALPPIVVLATTKAFTEFQDANGIPRLPPRWGAVDPKSRFVVACEGPAGSAPEERAQPVLQGVAEALVRAHASAPEYPREAWLVHGLTGYLGRAGLEPGTAPPPDSAHLGTLVEAVTREDLRGAYLSPLAELVGAPDFETVADGIEERAQALGGGGTSLGYSARVYHDTSVLFVHFLVDDRGGALRPFFLRYLQSSLAGGGGLEGFRAAFPGVELDRIERDFYGWVFETQQKNLEKRLDVKAIRAVFEERAAVLAAAEASAAASGTGGGPLDTSAIAIGRRDSTSRHALALDLARRGRLEEATAMMRELAERAKGGRLGERFAVEVERLEGFTRMRDAFLTESIAKKRRLSFEVDGKKRGYKVLANADGVLEIDDKKKRLTSWPVRDLDPFELAKGMSKMSDSFQPRGVPEWMRLYAYVLVGNSGWKGLLKDSSPEAEAFRAHAEDEYPDLMRIGDAARRLGEIAAMDNAGDAAEELLAPIESLVRDHGDVGIVKERLPALSGLAAAGLRVEFERRGGVAATLNGTVEELDDGVLKVTYEFEDPAELTDFVRREGYLAETRETWPKLLKSEADSTFEVDQGALTGVGALCYVHVLPFEAPMTVRWKVQHGVYAEGAEQVNDLVGICDDGAGSYASFAGLGSLSVIDRTRAYYKNDYISTDVPFDPRHVYAMELRHNGRQISTWVDGTSTKRLPCASRRRGAVFLFLHSDIPISFDGFEIEGRVPKDELESIREAWVERRLEGMGLR